VPLLVVEVEMDGEATLVVTVEMDNEAKSVGLVEREIHVRLNVILKSQMFDLIMMRAFDSLK
jgi:hypothetical protein